MNFVCVVFELCDKMLTLSSMENLMVPCNLNLLFLETFSAEWIPCTKFMIIR